MAVRGGDYIQSVLGGRLARGRLAEAGWGALARAAPSMDVQGFGRQRGQTEVYRGHEFTVNLLRKVQLMIAVNDNFLQPTIDAILRGARTGPSGEIGDGKIFVLPLEDCIRIRTGERGGEAI